MVKLTIDGREVTVPEGTTIRGAARELGIHTPTLCHHDRLNCGSNCRVCVVEVEGARVLAPSCSRQAEEGMKVRTDTDRVRHSRRMVLELLMTEADTSAAPELQAYAGYYGATPERFPGSESMRTADREPVRDNPFFMRDYAKCIACQRCVQACGVGIQHTFAIAMVGSGHLVSVGAGSATDTLTDSPCVFCGNCVGVCPTGALMALPEYDARAAGAITAPSLRWTPQTGLTEVE